MKLWKGLILQSGRNMQKAAIQMVDSMAVSFQNHMKKSMH